MALLSRAAATLCAVAFSIGATPAQAQQHPSTDTSFSYQGRLDDGGGLAQGVYDFSFTLYNRLAGGTALVPASLQRLSVDDGLFTAILDFGAGPLAGRELYLEIAVGPKDGPLTVLQPRQRVYPAPAAVQAGGANITATGDVILQRGPDTGTDSFVQNDPGTGPDNYDTAATFWQSFTAPYQARLDAMVILVKRPSPSTPAPSWVMYEGLGTGGTPVGVGNSSWSFGAGSEFLLEMHPSVVTPVFVPGRVYTFAISGTDLSFSQTAIIGAGVGRSSASANIASLFEIGVNRAGDPTALITSSGDLELNSGNPAVLLNADSEFQPTQIISTFAGSTGAELARWEFRARPTSYGLMFNGGSSILHVDGAARLLGLNETAPLASLHVQGSQLSLKTAAFEGEDIVVEDGDAVLGLYSNGGGSFGSAIALAEISGNGTLVDKWSIHRRTFSFNKELQFAYGTSNLYSANTINFALRPDGSAFLRGALQQNSSASQKHDVATLTDAIDTLLKLRGVSYTWNTTDKRDIGFLAEEMAEVLPDIVGFDETGAPIGIDYGRLTALIVEATKAQQQQLEALCRRVQDQGAVITRLAERLDQLETTRED